MYSITGVHGGSELVVLSIFALNSGRMNSVLLQMMTEENGQCLQPLVCILHLCTMIKM